MVATGAAPDSDRERLWTAINQFVDSYAQLESSFSQLGFSEAHQGLYRTLNSLVSERRRGRPRKVAVQGPEPPKMSTMQKRASDIEKIKSKAVELHNERQTFYAKDIAAAETDISSRVAGNILGIYWKELGLTRENDTATGHWRYS